MRHTEGKLTADRDILRGEEPYNSVAAVLDTWRIPREEMLANAERLAACWNFCQGVSTEALQTVTLGEVIEALQDIQESNNLYFVRERTKWWISRLQDSPQSAQEAVREEKGEEG